jgi:hypothetical protein
MVKEEEVRERLERNAFSDLQQRLVATSIQNGIRTQEDWNRFFGLEVKSETEEKLEGGKRLLPSELQTESALRILAKAISLSLCDHNYHWQRTKTLLAYFADCASEYLNLSQAEQDGKKKTLWKPFENLFDISGLATYKNTYTNKTGRLPIDHEIVESIFR